MNKGLTIEFETPVEVEVKPKRKITISKITISTIEDNYKNKTVLAKTNIGTLCLWKNQDYDNIGQWTDSDVETRIREKYEVQS